MDQKSDEKFVPNVLGTYNLSRCVDSLIEDTRVKFFHLTNIVEFALKLLINFL